MSQPRTVTRLAGAGVVMASALALAGCAGVLGGAGTATDGRDDDPIVSESEVTESPEAEPPVTPTPDEPIEGDADEGKPPTDSPSESTPADDRTQVDVIAATTMGTDDIVSAGGYVQGVIELGGTCYFTLTQGDAIITGESTAEPDATTTWCANVELRLPYPGDDWELELRYESPASVGVGSVTSEGKVS